LAAGFCLKNLAFPEKW